MSTSLSVQYTTLIEGFTKGIDSGGPFYRVILKITDWQKTDVMCNELMGYARVTGTTGNFTVTRGVPHQYPLSPNLFCVSAIVIQGLGNPILTPGALPNFDGGALIQAEYRCPPFNFGPAGGGQDLNNQIDPATPLSWCTQELQHTTDTITIAPSDPANKKIAATLQVPITILTLTFHKLPYLPMTTVRSLRGRVNSTLFMGSAAGLVLFKGADTHREFNTDGSVVQEVKLTFHERDAAFPWNSTPTKDAPYTWIPAVDVNGNRPFLLADLNPLVQF